VVPCLNGRGVFLHELEQHGNVVYLQVALEHRLLRQELLLLFLGPFTQQKFTFVPYFHIAELLLNTTLGALRLLRTFNSFISVRMNFGKVCFLPSRGQDIESANSLPDCVERQLRIMISDGGELVIEQLDLLQ
jgi:hypothetical protein